MAELVTEIFEKLSNDLGVSGWDYSRHYLNRSSNYYSYLKASKAQASMGALVNLAKELQRKRSLFERMESEYGRDEIYKKQRDYYPSLENRVMEEIFGDE